jgi:hypothetical protein
MDVRKYVVKFIGTFFLSWAGIWIYLVATLLGGRTRSSTPTQAT